MAPDAMTDGGTPEPRWDAMTGPDLELVRRWSLLPATDLWVRYVGLGGTAEYDGMVEYLQGDRHVDPSEHGLLVQALNEVLTERGLDQRVQQGSDRRPKPPDH